MKQEINGCEYTIEPRANLRHANLSGADLSHATGLLDPMTYITDHFETVTDTHGGVIGFHAYKTFGEYQPAPEHWVIEAGSVLTEVVNPSRVSDCASGINIATLDWVHQHSKGTIWKVYISGLDMLSVVVPYHTDGKIRCGRCTLIEEVERV